MGPLGSQIECIRATGLGHVTDALIVTVIRHGAQALTCSVCSSPELLGRLCGRAG